MLTRLLISAAVVFLLSSCTFAVGLAATGQMQGFSIDALNEVARAGGVGSAQAGNMVMVGHAQQTHNACCGSAAIQEETAILAQNASAAGVGSTSGVMQAASVDGLQGQLAASGASGSRAQGQAMNVSLDTVAYKAGGIGSAVGAQGVVGTQDQIKVTPNGISAGSQFVGAAQFAAVLGGPCSNVVVNNALDVTLAQGSTVIGATRPPAPKPPPCDP